MSQALACGGSEQIPGVDVQLSRKYHTTNKVRLTGSFYVYKVLSHKCSYLKLSKIVSWMRQEILSKAEGEVQGNITTCPRSQGYEEKDQLYIGIRLLIACTLLLENTLEKNVMGFFFICKDKVIFNFWRISLWLYSLPSFGEA